MLQCALCFITLTTTVIKELPSYNASSLIQVKAIQIILTQGTSRYYGLLSSALINAHSSLVRLLGFEWTNTKRNVDETRIGMHYCAPTQHMKVEHQ